MNNLESIHTGTQNDTHHFEKIATTKNLKEFIDRVIDGDLDSEDGNDKVVELMHLRNEVPQYKTSMSLKKELNDLMSELHFNKMVFDEIDELLSIIMSADIPNVTAEVLFGNLKNDKKTLAEFNYKKQLLQKALKERRKYETN